MDFDCKLWSGVKLSCALTTDWVVWLIWSGVGHFCSSPFYQFLISIKVSLGLAVDGKTLRDVGLYHLALVLNCSAPNYQPQVSFICIRSRVDVVKFHRNSGCFFGSQSARAELESQVCLAGTSACRWEVQRNCWHFHQVNLPKAALKSMCLGAHIEGLFVCLSFVFYSNNKFYAAVEEQK